MPRQFRSEESFHAESISRNAVEPFLADLGFQHIKDERTVTGSATSQLVSATSPDGARVKMRVRLCWRRRTTEELKYSAAQLRARLVDDDWDKTMLMTMQRDLDQGITHNLILQRDGALIVHAALIPIRELKGIFDAQARISQGLIDSGQMKNLKKNHAKNGSSPTVWLMDERTSSAHLVADALWNWPGVIDLMKLPRRMLTKDEDAMDDCPVPNGYAELGSDAPVQRSVLRAEFRRDRKVRAAVLKRTQSCERKGCVSQRTYKSFLDVHHILGIEISDRVWNCVALCPNCHRDAHFSPEADSINLELKRFAEQFKPVEDSNLSEL